MVSLLAATLLLVALTFLPALELRFSIPVGILAGKVTLPFFGTVSGFGLSWPYVFIVCVLANILLAAVFYWFLDVIVRRLLVPHWPWFAEVFTKRVARAQRKIHAAVQRWGWFGLALFIAIPFPGSGVYTGGIAAYALGMDYRRFLAASVLGCVIAGSLVTFFALGVINVFGFF